MVESRKCGHCKHQIPASILFAVGCGELCGVCSAGHYNPIERDLFTW